MTAPKDKERERTLKKGMPRFIKRNTIPETIMPVQAAAKAVQKIPTASKSTPGDGFCSAAGELESEPIFAAPF
jgi:hypothetical protein